MRPLALDLFCGAGGSTKGLQRAGFDVTGIDLAAQPRYCGDRFIQGDATRPPVDIARFDFIWASPPCQDYSTLKGLSGAKRGRLIPTIRDMLRASGVPYVIENVVGAELRDWFMLCGSAFGLGVWRHRRFEMHPPLVFTPPCSHHLCPQPIDVTGTGGPFNGTRKTPGGGISRKPNNLAHARAAMGIDWMNRHELAESIPPAYAEFIGREAMALLNHARAA